MSAIREIMHLSLLGAIRRKRPAGDFFSAAHSFATLPALQA